jgi:hypothetical protein
MVNRVRIGAGGAALAAALATVALAADLVDCNGNGIPDDVEIAEKSTFSESSGALSPFGDGFPQSMTLSSVPLADGPVNLLFEAMADLSAGNERVDLIIDGQGFGQILDDADDCSSPPDQHWVTLTAAQWNSMAADGEVLIEVEPNQNVDAGECSPTTFVSITVTYPIVPHNDVDQNGVLDVCQVLRIPDGPVLTQPGLAARYYRLMSPTSLPSFDVLTPVSLGPVPNLDFPETGGPFAGSGLSDELGAVFSGYVTVPEPGFYTFYLTSDDGSRLFIGEQLVVDNDGTHAMLEKSGVAAIEAGAHAIRVEFFERTGGAGLIASIEGGGLSKQVIPPAMFSHGGGCEGDADRNGSVGFPDLLLVLSNWGPCDGDPCLADVTFDGDVGFADLLAVLAGWGPCTYDVMIEDVSMSSLAVDAGDSVTVTVRTCSSSPSVTGNVIATLSSGGSTIVPIVIGPGCDTTADLVIQTPYSEGGCGQSVSHIVTVQLDLDQPDANPANDLTMVELGVTRRYWDLDFDLVGEPTSAPLFPCSCPLPWLVNWEVRVRNVGNLAYTNDGACLLTAIVPNSGHGDFDCPLDGWRFVGINGTIAPGDFEDFAVNGYRILCSSCSGPPDLSQWIKAEINYFPGGCDDPCGQGSGNNFVQEPITLIPTFCD